MADNSDISKLRDLKTKWYADVGAGLFRAISNTLDELGLSEDYIDQCERYTRSFPPRRKVIKDNVWGMVELDASSVRLIDCPAVQRLRGIRQLGFSYLTYPSAEHSRFAHSLGMYAVVQRFLDAMRNGEQPSAPSSAQIFEVPPSLRLDLLHAAILHDIGHLPFSHAGEAVFSDSPTLFNVGGQSVDDFLFDIADVIGKKLQFSEGLSLAISLSPRFVDYYRKCIRPEPGEDDAILRVAALIAGLRPAPELRCAADLISSSAVDADKVDYINRDALACGIPVGIDVARLFLRSSFLSVESGELAELLGESVSEREVIFIVNSSGVDTIEELAQAKTSLYQRVYLHQTTRNAERLFSKALEAIALERSDAPSEITDAIALLTRDDVGLLKELARSPRAAVCAIATRLRNRTLPKRACVLGRQLLEPFVPLEEMLPLRNRQQLFRSVLGATIERLRHDNFRGRDIGILEGDIAKEASDLRRLLFSAKREVLPTSDSPEVVSVLPIRDLAAPPKGCIVLENGHLIHSSSRLISEEQHDAAEIYKSVGYVMTDQEWREVVCLASRVVIERNFRSNRYPTDIELEAAKPLTVTCLGAPIVDMQEAVRRAGLRSDRIGELHAAAERSGYYDSCPQLSLASESMGRAIFEACRDFEGQGGWKITQNSARRFLSQFPPTLRSEFVDAFRQEFVILNRSKISIAFRKIIGELGAKLPSGVLVSLTPDSGNFVRMLAEHELKSELEGTGWRFSKSIEEALRSMAESETLVLCDDNISSGSQATAQLLAWLGVPRPSWPPGCREEHGIFDTPLESEMADRLKRINIAFAFCIGPPNVPALLMNELKGHGLNFRGDYRLGREVGASPVVLSPRLEEFLLEAGAGALGWCRYGKSEGFTPEERKDCQRDAPGYSGARSWLATKWSVPTSTYSALWCPGFMGVRPWFPLLIRRGYLKKLVVY